METLVFALCATGALVHGVGYLTYHFQTRRNASKPNPASWSIWSFMAILNAVSFDRMGKSTIDALQYYMGSFACFATFTSALAMGKVERLKKREWKILGIGLVAVAAWILFKDARLGNYIGLLAFCISFWPTLRDVIRDPHVETPGSWVIWTFACSCTLLAMIVQGKWASCVTPTVLTVAHGAVAWLCRPVRKKMFGRVGC